MTTSYSDYKTNLQPDEPDVRDYGVTFSTPSFIGKLLKASSAPIPPPMVDMRPQCPPIENQGLIGSCSAFATCVCHEIKQAQAKKLPIILSKLFTYYHARKAINKQDEDSGSHLRDNVKSLGTLGSPPQSAYPYDTKRWKDEPALTLHELARPNRINLYARVQQVQAQLEACLADGNPIICGLMLYQSFYNRGGVARTGLITIPNIKNEAFRGGHAVAIVGYDQRRKLYLMRNSWGTGWGQKGYAWIPYAYVHDKRLCFDLWMIKSKHEVTGSSKVLIPA